MPESICLVFGPFPCHWSSVAAGGNPITLAQVDTSSETGSNCGATVTITFGSTPSSGQLIVIGCSNTSATVSPPSGFTELGTPGQACQVFYKVAGGSETNSYSVIYTGTGASDALVLAGALYSGTFSTPVDTSASSANTRISPTITTTHNNEWILSIGGSYLTVTDFGTQPSGFSMDVQSPAGTANVAIAHLAQNTAGATGTNNWNTGTYLSAKVFTIGIRSE